MQGRTTGFVMVVGLLPVLVTAEPQPIPGVPITEQFHVRSHHEPLRLLIARGIEQSPTFRRMAETINASDGTVYIEPGVCRYGLRACLVTITSAGRHRYLFVKVDIGMADADVIALIGHELGHAVEVLSDPSVVDYLRMYFFFKSNRDRSYSSPAFETKAAIKAGQAVAEEIGRSERSKRRE